MGEDGMGVSVPMHPGHAARTPSLPLAAPTSVHVRSCVVSQTRSGRAWVPLAAACTRRTVLSECTSTRVTEVLHGFHVPYLTLHGRGVGGAHTAQRICGGSVGV